MGTPSDPVHGRLTADASVTAAAARARYRATGGSEDLDLAVRIWRESLQGMREDAPGRPACIAGLAAALIDRYDLAGRQSDLDEAIEVCRAAGTPPPSDPIQLAMVLARLASGMRRRHALTGRLADLEAAVDAGRHAAGAAPAGSGERATCLDALGGCLWARYLRRGDPADLDAAASTYREAVELTAAGSPDLPGRLSNLGNGLIAQYELTGDACELDEAVAAYQRAVTRAPAGWHESAMYLGNLGSALADRHASSGRRSDLLAAITAHRKAVALTPAGSPHLADRISNLASALRQRYHRDGRPEDLESAIAAYRRAVDLTPGNAPVRAGRLNNLATALTERYQRTGDLGDLEAAIDMEHRSVELTPADSPDLPGRLNNLATGMLDRHRRLGGHGDLEAAVGMAERVVELAPPRSADLPMYLSNLGIALGRRHEDTGRLEDLETAVGAHRRAVELTPPGSPELPVRMGNLGVALQARWRAGGEHADLDAAVDAQRRAAALAPRRSPERAMHLANLGIVLSERQASRSARLDVAGARDAFRRACTTGRQAAVPVTLTAAARWGSWAAGRGAWVEAVEAGRLGMEAMAHLLGVQLLRTEKETWLREAAGIPVQAAYALARTGELKDAALALEQGRAVLLTETLELDRADLDGVERAGRVELARRYRRSSERLSQLLRVLPLGASRAALEGHRRRLAAERKRLDRLAAAIREVPGCERFLGAVGFDRIAEAAKDQPLAYIAPTREGGVAIIVHPGASISAVWLPGLTTDLLADRVQAYLDAQRTGREDPARWWRVIEETTRWLWDAVMAPVTEALAPADAATLVPCGLLGLLPVHAAWTPDPDAPTGRQYALDRLVLRLAPNALAVRDPRRAPAGSGDDEVLVVEEPRPVRGGALPYSAREARAVASAFRRNTVLRHQQATRQAVLAHLGRNPVAHLVCHARASLADPLEGALVLAGDETLTVRDLITRRIPGLRLAVMSACETAATGDDLPDEALNLSTSLLHAGAAGAVGSLWAVADASTMLLMARFYQLWRGAGMDPARALRDAQVWLRDSTNEELRTQLAAAAALPVPPVPAAAAEFWESARPHSHPFHWAAFSYTGV